MIDLEILDQPLAAGNSFPSTEPSLDLDDIRKRVMADLPFTIEEERALLHSIRRQYTQQVAKVAKAKKADAAERVRVISLSATKGKQSTTQQLASLGGLDALDKF